MTTPAQTTAQSAASDALVARVADAVATRLVPSMTAISEVLVLAMARLDALSLLGPKKSGGKRLPVTGDGTEAAENGAAAPGGAGDIDAKHVRNCLVYFNFCAGQDLHGARDVIRGAGCLVNPEDPTTISPLAITKGAAAPKQWKSPPGCAENWSTLANKVWKACISESPTHGTKHWQALCKGAAGQHATGEHQLVAENGSAAADAGSAILLQ